MNYSYFPPMNPEIMIVERPLPFIKNYLEQINAQLKKVKPGYSLSKAQELWLGFCLSAILLTNSICWKRFERASLGKFQDSALSWMFHFSKICFTTIFHMSIEQILHNYGITEGVICIDDVDRNRSKSTKRLHLVHKLKDKLTGGYCDGQCLVFLFLVTPVASFPIAFEFYAPDRQWKSWKKEDDRLKRAKIPKKQRAPEPKRDPEFPTKVQISLELLQRFQSRFPSISIKAVLADGLYGHAEFVQGVQTVYPQAQVITKMKHNQLVQFQGKDLPVSTYFKRYPPVLQKVSFRGGEDIEIFVSSARLYVPSHGQKRFIIALRYPEEKECRYLLASDLSWRTLDIVQAFFFRWLIEFIFRDAK